MDINYGPNQPTPEKELDKNSSTEDLLKFATSWGYGDDEGMDASPSWMSQELDNRKDTREKLKKYYPNQPTPESKEKLLKLAGKMYKEGDEAIGNAILEEYSKPESKSRKYNCMTFNEIEEKFKNIPKGTFIDDMTREQLLTMIKYSVAMLEAQINYFKKNE